VHPRRGSSRSSPRPSRQPAATVAVVSRPAAGGLLSAQFPAPLKGAPTATVAPQADDGRSPNKGRWGHPRTESGGGTARQATHRRVAREPTERGRTGGRQGYLRASETSVAASTTRNPTRSGTESESITTPTLPSIPGTPRSGAAAPLAPASSSPAVITYRT